MALTHISALRIAPPTPVASGMRVEAGESIRLEISGCDAALRRFLKSKINDGNHTVYTGPHYPAVLTLPII